MPELPEVETVRRTLAPKVLGRRIVAVWRSPLALRREKPDRRLLERALHDARIDEVARAGKYLMLRTTLGGALVHLGMSGQLTVEKAGAPLRKHTHVRLGLDDDRELRLVDPRRFGLFRPFLANDIPVEWTELGLDPLAPSFTPDALHAALARTKRAVKLALLDQLLIAGLGNIYVSEALFLAGIHPATPALRVPRAKLRALRDAIVRVLTQGIENRGTSLSDYVDASGELGGNQNFLSVYGREGEGCVRCAGRVRMSMLGARSTFYCPRCQRR